MPLHKFDYMIQARKKERGTGDCSGKSLNIYITKNGYLTEGDSDPSDEAGIVEEEEGETECADSWNGASMRR